MESLQPVKSPFTHNPKWVSAAIAGTRTLRPAGTGLFVVLLLLAGAEALDKSSKKFFWFDEICTIAVVSQPSAAGVWSALANAADSNPPPFYLLEKLFVQATTDPHVGFRLL